MSWPKEITTFGRKWHLGWENPDRSIGPVAHYESREPDQVMVIRVVEHNGWYCASLMGDDKEGLDSALRELEAAVLLMEKWPS
jgi:hypothetical protein